MTAAIRVRVPATSANLGPGFDAFGLALGLYHVLDVVAATEPLRLEPAVSLQIEGEGCGDLPLGEDNLVVVALRRALAAGGYAGGDIELRSHSQIPLASGLGSSAAAWLAGWAAGQWLCQERLDRQVLLRCGTEREGHADNVTPCIFGGFCIVCPGADGAVGVARFEVPADLRLVVAVPDFPLATTASRSVLPATVTRAEAVHALAHASLAAAALIGGRLDLLRQALAGEVLHEPHRARLVPGLDVVRQAAVAAGALGAVLSGSGPSILAFVENGSGEAVGAAMGDAWASIGVQCRRLVLAVDTEGLQTEPMESS